VFSLDYLLLDAKKDGSRSANHSAVRFGLNDGGETGAEQEIIERGQQAVQTAQAGIGGGVLAVLHGLVKCIVCCYRKRIAGMPCPAL